MADVYTIVETNSRIAFYITEDAAGNTIIDLTALTDASGGGVDRVIIQGLSWQIAGGFIQLEWENGGGPGSSAGIMILSGNSNGIQSGPGISADAAEAVAGGTVTGDLNIINGSTNGYNLKIWFKKTAGFSNMFLLDTNIPPIGTP